MGWVVRLVDGTALCGLAFAHAFAGLWPGAQWLHGASLGLPSVG
jgi:hypothetical protein